MIYLITTFLISNLSSAAMPVDPCTRHIKDKGRRQICLSYFNEEKYESFLNSERVEQCEELYSEWPKTFRMCLRASSRDERMYEEKIRACHRNFYWVFHMRNCLKFAPLISVEEINECGETPSHRYYPMEGLNCINQAFGGTWPLEFEERVFKD